MKVDFLIVGQGIAGTSFAFELLRRNKSFIIIDNYISNSPSRVALGIYNPLILKWFTKPWFVDEQLKHFYSFYQDFNKFLNQEYVYDIGIYKLLKTSYDQNNWLTKSTSDSRKQYMSPELYSINNDNLINKEFYGLVKSAGRVNVPLLLESFRHFCIASNKLIQEVFDYNELSFKEDFVKFKDIEAKNIIFCQGPNLKSNPFFNYINLNPTKGELLKIYCKGLELKKIFHSRFLFIPLGADYYSIGATYDWENLNDMSPTVEAQKKMANQLDQLINLPYTIIEQKVGLRPSTLDRRPLLGAHLEYKNMYILNGLGTRGILLAPYLSKCLLDNIYLGTPFSSEVNVSRFSRNS